VTSPRALPDDTAFTARRTKRSPTTAPDNPCLYLSSVIRSDLQDSVHPLIYPAAYGWEAVNSRANAALGPPWDSKLGERIPALLGARAGWGWRGRGHP